MARVDDIRKLIELMEQGAEPNWQPIPKDAPTHRNATMYTLVRDGKPVEIPNAPGIYLLIPEIERAQRLALRNKALSVARVEMKITPLPPNAWN